MKTPLKAMFISALLAGATLAQPAPPDPATMIAHRVERLTSMLGLSSSQAAQATTIFTNAQTAITPIQTNVRTYRTSLQKAVIANDVTSIETLSGQIGTAEGQMLATESKANASFYAILTADQQTKAASMPGILGGGPGGMGMGPMGGPGGGPRMRPPRDQ